MRVSKNRGLLKKLLCVFWPGYAKGVNEHRALVVFKHWLLQKILRLNAHVPWPVHPTTKIVKPENITRGTRTPGLAPGCHIDGRNGIYFGSNVWIGPYVAVISMNHDINDFHRYVPEDPIYIGRNSWLATNSIILPGVEIGEHTVVAAGAVVTKSYPEGNQILAGVPAEVVKSIGKYRGS